MYTVDSLRTKYARTSDADLNALLAIDPERLTAESRQALLEEVARRGLRLPDSWTTVAAPPDSRMPFTAPRRYAKAPLGARFLAYLVDLAVGAGAVIAAVIVLVSTEWLNAGAPAAAVLAASSIWALWYSFTKDGREGGQSIGKEMLNLMVVNTETNQPCTKGESAVRALIWMVVNIVPVLGWLVEPIMAIATDDGRRLGDRAAGTQVIDARLYNPNG